MSFVSIDIISIAIREWLICLIIFWIWNTLYLIFERMKNYKIIIEKPIEKINNCHDTRTFLFWHIKFIRVIFGRMKVLTIV